MRTGGRGLCGASGGGVGDADRGGKKRGGVRVKCLARRESGARRGFLWGLIEPVWRVSDVRG